MIAGGRISPVVDQRRDPPQLGAVWRNEDEGLPDAGACRLFLARFIDDRHQEAAPPQDAVAAGLRLAADGVEDDIDAVREQGPGG